MMFVPKTIDELTDDAIFATLAQGGPLTDFSKGSTTFTMLRGVASVVADGYADLTEARTDSNPGTAVGPQLDSHVNAFGVFRKQGSLSVGAAIATPKVGAVSTIVVAGSLRLTVGNLAYVNTVDVTLAAPYTMVPLTATQIGAAYDLPPGTVMVDASGNLTNTWNFVVGTNGYDTLGNPTGFLKGGSDKEQDGPLLLRFQDALNSLSSGTYKAVYTAVTGVPDVQTAVLQQYKPAVGWMTVYVDDGTDAPSPALLAAVAATLDAEKGAGIGYKVLALPKLFVPLTLQVRIDPTFVGSVADLVQAVVDQLKAALNAYTFGEALYLTKIDAIAHSVPGVIQVIVAAPLTDIIPSSFEAIRPGVVTVTAIF